MDIVLNGERRSVPDEANLAAVLEQFRAAPEGVAVAVDGSVVPRSSWSATAVRPGAVVEVLAAVQGG